MYILCPSVSRLQPSGCKQAPALDGLSCINTIVNTLEIIDNTNKQYC